MDFKYLKNRSDKKYTFALYGEIGVDVDGHILAHEINYASEQVDVIEVHINSEGGSVMHGLSIFSALRNSTAKVVIMIDGIAASIAGVVAMSGDEINMVDYGRLMIHDPIFEGRQKLTKKESRAIESIRTMLVTIFNKRSGRDQKWVNKVMEEETWFNADEALKEKLIDSIIKTDRTIDLAGLSPTEMVAKIQNLHINHMKDIAKKLNLSEDATKEQILKQLDKLNSDINTARESVVNTFMAVGKSAGVITDANKERFEKLAKADIGLALSFLDEAGNGKGDAGADGKGDAGADGKGDAGNKNDQNTLRISDILKELRSGMGGEKTPEHDYDWFMKNDSKGLKLMEDQEPEKFKKLYDAWVAKK